MDPVFESGEKVRFLGWLYGLPNLSIPFMWYRIAVP